MMKYGGAFYLGVHKATLGGASVAPPARVKVSIELDDVLGESVTLVQKYASRFGL